MTPDTAFTKREFERLGGTTNEAEAVHSLRPRIDRLIDGLNTMTVAREIDAVRAIWNPGLKPGTFFRPNIWMGVDYAHGRAGHWYVFHRGGRWEPQFNIGMYGLPGAGYLRVGLGFGLTAESRDPDRVAGFAQVRALFAGFHHLAKRDLRSSLAKIASRAGAILEQQSDNLGEPVQSGPQAIDWLCSLRSSEGVRWLFLGRALYAADDADREILEDWRQLRWFIAQEFETWAPLWRQIWAAA